MKTTHALSLAAVFLATFAAHSYAQELGEGEIRVQRLSGCLFVIDGSEWVKTQKRNGTINAATNLNYFESGAYPQGVRLSRKADGPWSLTVGNRSVEKALGLVWKAPYDQMAQTDPRGHLSQACGQRIEKDKMYMISADSLFVADRTQPALVHKTNKNLRLYPLVSLVQGAQIEGDSVYAIFDAQGAQNTETFVMAGSEAAMKRKQSETGILAGVDIAESAFVSTTEQNAKQEEEVSTAPVVEVPAIDAVEPEASVKEEAVQTVSAASAAVENGTEAKSDKFIHRVGRWFKDTAKQTGSWFKETAQDAGRWIKGAAKATGNWFKSAAKSTGAWFGKTYKNTASWVRKALGKN